MMTAANRILLFNDNGLILPSSASNHIVDASTEGIAWGFQADSANAITHLGFRYGARTGTPPTYLIRLEGLDSGGLPDNTDVGGGSPTAVTFTPPADATIDGLWQWKTLTNAYTPTRGQMLASVIRYSSGTIDGSNNSSFTRTFASYPGIAGLPYQITNTSGTWTKSSNGPLFGYRTASGRHGYIGQSVYQTNTAGTNGHGQYMHFTLPAGWGDTFKVLGISAQINTAPTGQSSVVVLRQTDGTLLQDITLDADHSSTSGTTSRRILFNESTLATLSYGTKYYVGVEVASSNAVGMRGMQLAEAADREGFPNGLNRGYVSYNGATFTEDDTIMPFCDLILDDITEPAGGAFINSRRNTMIGR